MIQNSWSDDARRDVDPELEVDIEGDVDDSIFESDTLAFRLDDDKHVDVGLGCGVAPCFGPEQAHVHDVFQEVVSEPLHEFG
jgi:hypothetical protein